MARLTLSRRACVASIFTCGMNFPRDPNLTCILLHLHWALQNKASHGNNQLAAVSYYLMDRTLLTVQIMPPSLKFITWVCLFSDHPFFCLQIRLRVWKQPSCWHSPSHVWVSPWSTSYASSHVPSLPATVPTVPSPSNLLTPLTVMVSTSHAIYHILPLSLPDSLGQPPPWTQQDLILPPCSAFASAIYPPFTTCDCTWQYLFDRITNPSKIWLLYTPGSLGDYLDIKSLWQAWDEGAFVIDVGQTPALRLIDARWGNLKSQETHWGRLPSWRPTNNEKVGTSSCCLFDFSHIIFRLTRSGWILFSLFTTLRTR